MSCKTQLWASTAAIAASLACFSPGRAEAQASAPEPAWQAGASFQRTLTGAKPDLLRIPLTKGLFIRLEVMQTGIDLFGSLRDPAANLLTEVDSGNGNYGPETVIA